MHKVSTQGFDLESSGHDPLKKNFLRKIHIQIVCKAECSEPALQNFMSDIFLIGANLMRSLRIFIQSEFTILYIGSGSLPFKKTFGKFSWMLKERKK